MPCPQCGQPTQRAISLDYTGRRLLIGDQEIHLTGREADILTVLLERIGQYVASERLFVRVWGSTVDVEDPANNVSVHLAHLRKKLKDQPIAIRNARGSGFALVLQ